jgi:hypothetical protein
MNKLTQSELRMQMLAGVITESEYKAKLEEVSVLTKLARKIGWAGEDWTPKEFASQIKSLDDETLLKWAKDNKGIPNTPLAFQQKLVKIEMAKRGLDQESLNESMIGGIVGIGAITQIPSRAKADYEDAFEHFLSQKYDLKENEDDMPKAPSHEETDASQVYEEEVNEARISPDNAVAYLENTLGHVWNMGTGKNDIDLQSLAQSIAQDLGLIEDLEEGKEVEEPTNY